MCMWSPCGVDPCACGPPVGLTGPLLGLTLVCGPPVGLTGPLLGLTLVCGPPVGLTSVCPSCLSGCVAVVCLSVLSVWLHSSRRYAVVCLSNSPLSVLLCLSSSMLRLANPAQPVGPLDHQDPNTPNEHTAMKPSMVARCCRSSSWATAGLCHRGGVSVSETGAGS